MNNTTGEILLYGYIMDGAVTALSFTTELNQLALTHKKINIRINSGIRLNQFPIFPDN